jgi:hypothetical protein
MSRHQGWTSMSRDEKLEAAKADLDQLFALAEQQSRRIKYLERDTELRLKRLVDGVSGLKTKLDGR